MTTVDEEEAEEEEMAEGSALKLDMRMLVHRP